MYAVSNSIANMSGANGLGKMSLELLRHVRQIIEEQESKGGPMLVASS